MTSEGTRAPEWLWPIEDGRVSQVVVEYCGGRLGGVTYRGMSGRTYRFDASPESRHCWVIAEDVPRFRAHVDFVVHEATWIDAEAERIRAEARLVAEALLREVIPPEALAVDQQGEVLQATRRRRKRGRPPVPADALAYWWHLAHHCQPRWTHKELGERFLGQDYADPAGAMSQRLSRYRLSPDAIRDPAQCPRCAAGDYPLPPGRA